MYVITSVALGIAALFLVDWLRFSKILGYKSVKD